MASSDAPPYPLQRFAERYGLSPLATRELRALVDALSTGGGPPSPSLTLTSGPTLAGPGAVDPEHPLGVDFAGLPFFERYEDQGVIGMGGMGEVRRVYDRLLERTLAVKILRWEKVDNVDARARFLAEARVNARLQHPGVVAVHEQGELPDGRPWFTMKEVRGRTLGDAIRARFREVPDAPSPRRLIEVFARVCRTVAYAHAQGVVHRDIKPANIMLGEFGEVLVLDWGIARVGADPAEPAVNGAGGPTRRAPDLPGETREGRVMGTPAYMAPEQARGEHDRVGPAADAYALGAVLYHVLAGQPPYRGTSVAVLARVRSDPPPPIDRVRHPRAGPAPPDLVALCERAMARDPEGRPTVDALAGEIEGWLDGVRKAAQARAIVQEADAMLPRIADLQAEMAALQRQAAAILDPLPDHAPVADKRPGWDLEDAARAKRSEAELTEVRMLQTLRSALHLVPDLPEAHARLAAFYQDRLRQAEQARDGHTARIYEELVRTHDRGGLVEWLAGDGRVTLVTDPPGARVMAWRHEARDRRLIEVPHGELGRTPLRGARLPRGSHMLVIEAEGRPPVRYPVDIGRGSHWDGIPPGGTESHVIHLPTADELEPDDVYVPAGWCIIGGDDDAADSLSRRRVWLDGFVVRRYPVTNAEYVEFLDDLLYRRGADAARRHVPRENRPGGERDPHAIYHLGSDDRFVLGVDQLGWQWQMKWPVVHIDWHDAAAYAAWRAERDGLPWRLCHGFEHEKAARGVDGRHLPWGDHFEHTWANVLNSRAGPPAIRPVGCLETDLSPYRVSDTVGNVRTWCCGAYLRDGDAGDGERVIVRPATGEAAREIRGGCWHSSPYLGRIAGRFGAEPRFRYSVLGLRLARPLR